MKQLVILLALACALAACAPATAQTSPAKPFAMRTYTFVLLRRGSTWTAEQTPETRKIFEGHMANIQAMGKAGKLVLAGPFDAPADDRSAYAGLFVLDVASEAEARALLANDPAVRSGRFTVELRTWLGPAGITYDGAGKFTP
ncbi:MAG TPA: YciI family protein [Kofleriaceae bacterium]